jgi:hypothetical protein
MNRLTIELLDPRAKALLEDLAKLDLIRITESPDPQGRFAALLRQLRAQEAEAPSLEEITEEVEGVRAKRSKGRRNGGVDKGEPDGVGGV